MKRTLTRIAAGALLAGCWSLGFDYATAQNPQALPAAPAAPMQAPATPTGVQPGVANPAAPASPMNTSPAQVNPAAPQVAPGAVPTTQNPAVPPTGIPGQPNLPLSNQLPTQGTIVNPGTVQLP